MGCFGFRSRDLSPDPHAPPRASPPPQQSPFPLPFLRRRPRDGRLCQSTGDAADIARAQAATMARQAAALTAPTAGHLKGPAVAQSGPASSRAASPPGPPLSSHGASQSTEPAQRAASAHLTGSAHLPSPSHQGPAPAAAPLSGSSAPPPSSLPAANAAPASAGPSSSVGVPLPRPASPGPASRTAAPATASAASSCPQAASAASSSSSSSSAIEPQQPSSRRLPSRRGLSPRGRSGQRGGAASGGPSADEGSHLPPPQRSASLGKLGAASSSQQLLQRAQAAAEEIAARSRSSKNGSATGPTLQGTRPSSAGIASRAGAQQEGPLAKSNSGKQAAASVSSAPGAQTAASAPAAAIAAATSTAASSADISGSSSARSSDAAPSQGGSARASPDAAAALLSPISIGNSSGSSGSGSGSSPASSQGYESNGSDLLSGAVLQTCTPVLVRNASTGSSTGGSAHAAAAEQQRRAAAAAAAARPSTSPAVPGKLRAIAEGSPDSTARGAAEEAPVQRGPSAGPVPFSYKQVEEMTRGFDERGLLGEGGFGPVFKGSLRTRGGRTVAVAVKELQLGGHQGEKEWLTEVSFLGLLAHPNLVQLIGYCAEGQHRHLVYEFAPHGSLEFKLFNLEPHEQPLTWHQRLCIAYGAARGLAYLHEEAEHPVIFRDFKTSNILLTSHMEAKLSDFGLARSGPDAEHSHVSTRVVGTVGYAAPEYVLTGHLTVKSDVYGFGVVLLEILTGRVALDKSRPKQEQSLVDWAQPFLQHPAKLYRIMDPLLRGRYSCRGAQLTAYVVRRCLQHKPKHRPLMSEVVAALEPVLQMHDMAGFTG